MSKRLSLNTALLAGLAGAAGLGDGIDIGPREFPDYQPTRTRGALGQSGFLTNKTIAKRRAANRIARKSRKANRSKKR